MPHTSDTQRNLAKWGQKVLEGQESEAGKKESTGDKNGYPLLDFSFTASSGISTGWPRRGGGRDAWGPPAL